MKHLPSLLLFALVAALPANAADSTKLPSTVFDWEKMVVTPTANGVRRSVLDGSTTTLDKLHVHITTLNPGQNSGEPRKHLQEEVIVVKEGIVEAHIDGKTQMGASHFLASAK